MKSDKRHEMQKNELADWLGEQVEAIKPHAFPITVGVLLVVGAIILGFAYWGGGPANASAWDDYFSALSERDPSVALEAIATREAGSPVGMWATQSVGDHFLTSATMEIFRDRETAHKSLEKAEVAYKKVESAASDPFLKNRARLGLAKVYESLDKPEEAAKWYKLVADADKESAIGKAAEKAARRVSDPREVAMLAWFAKQKPRRPTPTPGAGTGLPGLPNDLPERPDLSLPAGGSFNLDGIGTDKPTEPALDFPKPGETKQVDPASTKPEEKPADPAKPEEKPAEKPAEPAATEQPAEKPASEKPAEPKP